MRTYKGDYSLENLVEQISDEINTMLRANLYEVGLNEDEMKRLRIRKNELREALGHCGIGDNHAKEYVKSIIAQIFSEKWRFDKEDYQKIIPFQEYNRMTAEEQFYTLLYDYKKEYQTNAFTVFIEENQLLQKKTEEEEIMQISEEDIHEIYYQKATLLTEEDMKQIVVQKVYAAYRGLGIIDELRDMNIDGISGGVSGKENQYNCVWVFYHGMMLHLAFLDFQTERELERICMNIYRYGNPGQLSKTKGYIVNEMKDHSRVVVVRPPFAESFAFFVRKFGTIEKKTLEELITDTGCEVVIELLKWLIKGCQICAVTGAQGTGKTTLLMGLVGYIHPAFTLRVQEMAFELHLRETYPNRNILTFRETESISGQEGLDLQKKTDGVVNILGEVATIEVAAYLIQMSQVGSLFTLFTHHAKTTESLIKYMRNSLLSCGLFRDEGIAREQVVDAIRFDIHLEKDIEGHRYIERVSEIVPTENEKGYRIVDLVTYENDTYMFQNQMSDMSIQNIRKRLSKAERSEFSEKYVI